jgi:hypothetical protein
MPINTYYLTDVEGGMNPIALGYYRLETAARVCYYMPIELPAGTDMAEQGKREVARLEAAGLRFGGFTMADFGDLQSTWATEDEAADREAARRTEAERQAMIEQGIIFPPAKGGVT